MDSQIGFFFLNRDIGIHGRRIGPYFKVQMQGFMDRQIGQYF